VFEVPSMMSNPPFEGAADIPSIFSIPPMDGRGNNSENFAEISIVYIKRR
jgi:hypothetical protein